MNPLYRKTRFLLSAPDIRHLPPDRGREVAFAGRSNAGKSSAINAITDQRSLARVSKTPGRTQQINVFPVTEDQSLVDLPGYGYAKVPDRIKAHWERELPRYLEERQSLVGLVLIMDIRHPLTDFDHQMLAWCQHAELPVHILLTKADKLKRGPAMSTRQKVAAELDRTYPGTTVQMFSATARTGVDEVHGRLDEWLGLRTED
jgi:GTP-binding protein